MNLIDPLFDALVSVRNRDISSYVAELETLWTFGPGKPSAAHALRLARRGSDGQVQSSLREVAPVMDALSFVCLMCGDAFEAKRGLQTHQASCGKRFPTTLSSQETEADEAEPDEAENESRRRQLFRETQQCTVVRDLATLRYDLFTPASHVDRLKHIVSEWVGSMRDEVTRRLAPMVSAQELPTLRSSVAAVMDAFNGIESAKKEAAALRKTLPLLHVTPRQLGKRMLTVKDAEGIRYQSKGVSHIVLGSE